MIGPVNHIAAGATLFEMWKAKHFRVNSIIGAFSNNVVTRHESNLRTSRDPKSFVSKSVMLWNQMSREFQPATTTPGQAKAEIRQFVQKLPSL